MYIFIYIYIYKILLFFSSFIALLFMLPKLQNIINDNKNFEKKQVIIS